MTLAELLARQAPGAAEALAIARAVASALAELHARGRLHGGIHPGSILIDDGGAATLAPAAEPLPPDADAGADIHALGAVLGELLAGVPPAERPRELVTVVARATDRDPAARTPTARELCADLRRPEAWTRARRWLRRNRAAVAVAAAALGTLAALGGLGLDHLLRARAVAERRGGAPEQAQRVAEERTSELILSQAAASLDRDPTAALAWLKLYPEDGPRWSEARATIAQAVARGAARHVLRIGVPVTGVAVSRDGRLVAAGGADGGVALWDMTTRRRTPLAGHTAAVRALAFAPDGRTLVTGGKDRTLRLWELGPAPQGRVLASLGGEVGAVSFTALGDAFAYVVAGGGGARLRDVATGKERPLGHDPGLADPAFAGAVASSPDGRLVAIGGEDAVRLWEPRSGELTLLPGHAAPASSLAFAGDGTLVTGSSDGTVRVWDPRPQRTSYHGMTPPMSQPVFTRDGRRVIYGGGDGRLVIRDPTSGAAVELTGHTGVMSLDLSSDGRTLLSADRGRAFVWDVASATGRPLWTARDARLGLSGIRGSGDGRLIALLDGQTLFLLDAASGAPRCETAARAFAIAPDGARVAIAVEAAVALVDVASCARRELYRHAEDGTDALAFSPDGSTLASGGAGDAVGLYGFARGEVQMLLGHAASVGFSPDGRQLVSADPVRLRDVATGTLVTTLRGHRGWVRPPLFTPDGEVLVTAGEDGDVRLWNLRTGENDVLRGHAGPVTGLALSPDGSQVATTGQDGTLRLWPVDPTGGRPSDPARLHAWLEGETTAEIDDERRATSR